MSSKSVRTPYSIFCDEMRLKIKADMPDLSSKEISDKLVKSWNKLSFTKKRLYIYLSFYEKINRVNK